MKPKIPLIGLGTWKLSGKQCENAVRLALDIGYRLIDTADMYQNHHDVARGIKSFPREKIFLVSKLWLDELSPKRVMPSVMRILKELHSEYLDLLLIHWPWPQLDLPKTIEAMLECKSQGLVRSIGFSNFVRSHLETLAPYHFPIVCDQFELNPYLQRKKLVAACKDLGLHIMAHRPLDKGTIDDDPILKKIGEKYDKSASQVTLRWLVQQDITAIPKASSPEHLKENFALFDFQLTAEDLEQIAQLNTRTQYVIPEGYPYCED